MTKIVKVLSTEKVDTDIIAKVEEYDNDFSENIVWTLPNFESRPLSENQVLMAKTDKRGENAILLIPLETDINEGETRIKSTDSNGNEKLNIHLKDNGKLQISNNTNELITVLSDLVNELISALVITSIGSQPFVPDTIAALTLLKSKIDTFKE